MHARPGDLPLLAAANFKAEEQIVRLSGMTSSSNNASTSSFDELCTALSREFPAIEAARRESRQTENKIRSALSAVKVPPDIVFGSLARLEWTSGSDVDWTLLVDGPSDPEHFALARDIEKGFGLF